MNSAVTTEFDLGLVALSFLFAVIGSFVALTAAGRVKARDGRISLSNLITVGVALGGIGVWSMHFIGMLALQMDVGSSYSMTETFASLLVVVVAASLAVRYAAHNPESLPRLAVAGTGLGLSVVVMHYLGMFGLKINGYIRWDYGVVVLSIVIAVVAATAALWLAFNSPTLNRRVAAALAMVRARGAQAQGYAVNVTERAAIDELMTRLNQCLQDPEQSTAATVEAATKALADGTEAFAAQRMNRGIQQALAGRRVQDI